MQKRLKMATIVLISLWLCLLLNGQSGSIDAMEVIEDSDGLIKFSIYDVAIRGMYNRHVHFGMYLSQGGEWLAESWVELEPVLLPYEHTVWEGLAFWFHYPYKFLMQQGDPDQPYWGSFFIVDSETGNALARKDLEFSLGIESSGDADYDLIPSEGSIVNTFDWLYEGKRYRETFTIAESDYNLSIKERDSFQPLSGRSGYENGYIMLWEIDIVEFYTELYGYLYQKNRHRLNEIKTRMLTLKDTYDLDYREFTEFVISWVQHTTYELPEKMYGIYTQLELVALKTGDCDTRSVILYTLFRDLGYDVVIFYSEYYQHAMLGIAGVGSGDYLKYNGVKYYFVETTATGWEIGTLPPEWSNTRHWQVIIPRER